MQERNKHVVEKSSRTGIIRAAENYLFKGLFGKMP
jgi:hypothetical protein